MKNILIPVDFSKHSRHALNHAIKFASGTNTGLHLVHVFEFDLHFNAAFPEFQSAMTADATQVQKDYSPEIQLRELQTKAEEDLEKFKTEAEKSGLMVTTKVESGRAHKAIIRYAREQGMDLIVMGTHGSTGFEELFWGSNAQRVARLAPCPVMAVKDDPQPGNIDSLLMVSDLTDEDSAANIDRMIELRDYLDADLKALYVNTPSEFETTAEIEENIAKHFSNKGLESHDFEILNALTVEDGVVDYCEKNKPDLVVLTTHGRKGIRRLFKGNLAEVLVNHLDVPVLIYHQKDQ